VIEAVGARALDRRKLDDVPAGEHRWQVFFAIQAALVDERALQREHRAHLGEQIP
jgi:hypothetical protein